jgi:hypothetical protein
MFALHHAYVLVHRPFASVIDIVVMWVQRHMELGGVAEFVVALSPVPGTIALVVLVLPQIRRLVLILIWAFMESLYVVGYAISCRQYR